MRIVFSFGALLAISFCLNANVRAQDQLVVPSPAPPPMKFMPGLERTQLSNVRDSKARLKTSIGLAETRLLRAEQFTVDQRFVAATVELGVYQAIIEDALRFLDTQKADTNKTRDLYKRLEIQLRLHATRIESIRRVTPAAYAVHVKAIWDFSDNARARALNGFFSDTVMQSRSEENGKNKNVEASPAVPVTNPDNQP